MPTRRPSSRSTAAPSASPAPVLAVIVSRYNASITDRLLAGAREAYAEAGGDPSGAGLRIIPAPGSYELPALALAAACTGAFRGVLAIGCLIKGETSHDRYIADAVAQGLVHVTIATGIPCAFGVLTVDTPEQADDRAGGEHGNKGAEGMSALIDTVREIDLLASRSALAAARPARPRPDKAARRTARRSR